MTFSMRACIAASILCLPALPVLSAPREVNVERYVSLSPVFASRTSTLDPLSLARLSWKGWISKRGIPWGMTTGLKPTLRLSFDCRALPWPSIKQHSVDGPDNNMRTLGGLAMLHDMFGDEFKNDPAEAGIIAYLASCTDPISGIPYSPDSMNRGCAIGHGEFVKNLILMYQYTGNPVYKTWAAKAISTLHKYGVVYNRPGIGQVATYYRGMFNPSEPFSVGAKPVNDNMGGWLHLGVGWNTWAFAKWYEVTKDKNALDFGVALANRLCYGEDPDGNDGSFRPDGSFGGNKSEYCASWHMHGHTHCLPGLMHLGSQLIGAGRKSEGLKFINRTKNVFDWLYDPTRNPDAGSLTGWLGEWIQPEKAIPGRKPDCEGCTMGDVVQTAVALGAASRLDPSLKGYVDYYDRAEQIFTGQLAEQTFRLTPTYLKVMKECLTKRVDKDMAQASAEVKAQEVDKRYRAAVSTAERMVGQQLGACGFPDWVNVLKSDLDPDLPGIHMQGCCADATIRAAHAIWSETVTGNRKQARVNLAFNRDSDLVKVVSCLPHRGEIDVMVKSAKSVLVRVPYWAQKQQVKAYVNRHPVKLKWDGHYVVFDNTTRGRQLTLTYPLRIAQIKETINGVDYTEKWRGNSIVDISPKGKWIPIFNRPELEAELVR